MSENRARALIVAAFVVSVFYVLLAQTVFGSGVLLAPSDACSGAVDLSECYQLYIADRLYERHGVDVGAASFVGEMGPGILVLGAAGLTLLFVRSARVR